MPIPESAILTPEPLENHDPRARLVQEICNRYLRGEIDGDEWEAELRKHKFEEPDK